MPWGSLLRWAPRSSVHRLPRRYFLLQRRCISTTACRAAELEAQIAKTRNIGIIAHIDAGKTTTTERMLYYSGHTRLIGNVDEGSTVTDFLPAERARGITIQSAAITFHWPPKDTPGLPAHAAHTINLIDTPGHSDFTFEVIRSLRILDGAICILDGVAGVEAQTEKVWFQAGAYGIPRIIYVNKLDRDGAAFGKSVRDVAAKLQTRPAVCQIPWFKGGTSHFQGVVDIIRLVALEWPADGDGRNFRTVQLQELEVLEPKLAQEAKSAREALIEVLGEQDDRIVEQWEEQDGDALRVSAESIRKSLRRCLLDPSIDLTPVFAGASFRNIGVQPVLDAVNDLLPDPSEVPEPQARAQDFSGGLYQLLATEPKKAPSRTTNVQPANKNVEACALAFKVVHDQKKGMLVYVRVYHGALKPGSTIFNTNLQLAERVPRLLRMYGSDSQDVDSISAGQIGVITGLKKARTGDTLISYRGMNPKNGPPAPFKDMQLRPIDVPPPVFFASVEPLSLSEDKAVKDALNILLREDPSLQLTVDEDSGQLHLNGMGELHLEIARDRLINDLKAKAHVGNIEIGYRECVTAFASVQDSIYDKEIAGKLAKAGCSVSIEPLEAELAVAKDSKECQVLHEDGNRIETRIINSDPEAAGQPARLPLHLSQEAIHRALQNGALSGLGRGPQYYFRMHGISATIEMDVSRHIFGKDTTPSAISAAARSATLGALRASADISSTALIEPVMNVIVHTDEASMGTVMHDILSARGGQIISTDEGDAAVNTAGLDWRPSNDPIDLRKIYAPPDPFAMSEGGELLSTPAGSRQRPIVARIPLREMVGYLKHLRSLTAGRGTFVMSVDRFEKMNSARIKAVMKELRGI